MSFIGQMKKAKKEIETAGLDPWYSRLESELKDVETTSTQPDGHSASQQDNGPRAPSRSRDARAGLYPYSIPSPDARRLA